MKGSCRNETDRTRVGFGRSSATVLLVSVAALVLGRGAQAIDITFSEVAADVGLTYSGETFGQSWGDYDRDGYADLYVSNHGKETTLYKNNGGVSFTAVNDLVTANLEGDIHGGAWGDFDNDGDRDLLFTEGSSGLQVPGPNRLLVNNDGTFVDEAEIRGVQDPFARSRMATWMDWNQDGKLDLGLATWPRSDGQGPTSIYTQQEASFAFDNPTTGFAVGFSNNFMKLIQVSNVAEPALLVDTVFGFPRGFYDISQVPFVSLTQSEGLPNAVAVWDMGSEDFDGNLDQEIFLVRMVDVNEVELLSDTELHARVYSSSIGELTYRFKTQGAIDVEIGPAFGIPLGQIEIGPEGINPESLAFSLDPTDPDVVGTSTHSPVLSRMYMHYDQDLELWQVSITNTLAPNVRIVSQNPITDLSTEGFVSDTGARTAIKYNQSPEGYVSFPIAFGLDTSYPCRSAALADFDNDMDVDVYLGCTSSAINRPNVLLENNGQGVFTEVIDAAGAVGTNQGRTDVVSAADYDNDGFIDLLVSNGLGKLPFSNGPTELFKNQGNGNNWVHIDLVGLTANRDGVGAWVELTAGGVTQSRLQDNGVKRFGQDDQRIHFGLAQNTVIDSVRIRWPGGQEQFAGPFDANQILTIVQFTDSDGDGLEDTLDNCRLIANVSQTDTDGDGFGNRCDPDFNNDGIVNFLDLTTLGERFLTNDALADLNGDGAVNFIDVSIFSTYFTLPPGPGAFILE